MAQVMSGNARWTLDGKTVFHATECTLSFSRQMKERNTKDTDGREVAKGIKSFTLSTSTLATYNAEGEETHDFGSLFDLYNDDSDTKISVEFVPDEVDATFKLTGQAVITSLEGSFTVEEDGTSSLTMEGGAMTKVALPVVPAG